MTNGISSTAASVGFASQVRQPRVASRRPPARRANGGFDHVVMHRMLRTSDEHDVHRNRARSRRTLRDAPPLHRAPSSPAPSSPRRFVPGCFVSGASSYPRPLRPALPFPALPFPALPSPTDHAGTARSLTTAASSHAIYGARVLPERAHDRHSSTAWHVLNRRPTPSARHTTATDQRRPPRNTRPSTA